MRIDAKGDHIQYYRHSYQLEYPGELIFNMVKSIRN